MKKRAKWRVPGETHLDNRGRLVLESPPGMCGDVAFGNGKDLCGREQTGGVALYTTDKPGDSLCGGVLTRQQVVMVHKRLTEILAEWQCPCGQKE